MCIPCSAWFAWKPSCQFFGWWHGGLGRLPAAASAAVSKVTTAPPPPDFPLTAEEWLRPAAEARESAKGMAIALQAYLDDAQRSGSNVVRHNLHRMLFLAPAIAAAQRSRDWAGVQRLSQEFRGEVEQHSGLTGCTAYFRDRTFEDVLDSLQPRCSGCGAVAVGLRKCSACKRAQYVSASCCCLPGR